jgi:hypothetical protein
MKKRYGWALGINVLICLTTVWILINGYFGFIGKGQGPLMFRYFTEDSNLLLGIACFLSAICEIRYLASGQETPSFFVYFKFVATVGVTTTFLVVLLYLIPGVFIRYGTNGFVMWGWPNMLFSHLFNPVLAFVSFVLLETEPSLSKKFTWVCTIPPILYAVIVGCFASLHLFGVDNVYGFMDATANAWWVTPIACVLIIGGTYLSGALILFFRNKMLKKEMTFRK